VVAGKIFKQKTGSEGKGCCMGKKSGTPEQMVSLRGGMRGWI